MVLAMCVVILRRHVLLVFFGTHGVGCGSCLRVLLVILVQKLLLHRLWEGANGITRLRLGWGGSHRNSRGTGAHDTFASHKTEAEPFFGHATLEIDAQSESKLRMRLGVRVIKQSQHD